MARRNNLEFMQRLAQIADRLDAEKANASRPDAPKKPPKRVPDLMAEIKKELANKNRKG
jgi:hypothetical protein